LNLCNLVCLISHVLGSEHTIDRIRFPAEVQLMAFNSDLYENFTDAMTQPRGVLAISIIVDVSLLIFY
jgi:hypothetical protein